jgi:hypothetical protein
VIPAANDSDPVRFDGAELLDRVRASLSKHVAFANEHQSVAATLWAAATHALGCAGQLCQRRLAEQERAKRRNMKEDNE